MVTIVGEYVGELRCAATHTGSGANLITDAPVDNHGRGAAFSPTDLLATGLATCILTTIAIWAQRHELTFGPARFVATKEMSTTSPRRIARLAVNFKMPGNFTAEQRDRIEAVSRACPVHQSLHPSVVIDLSFDWTGDT